MSTMTLKMPVNYVDIDKDEMEYFEGGGIYVSNAQIKDVLTGVRIAPGASVGAITAGLVPVIPVAFAWINAMPGIGQVVFALILANSGAASGAIASAYVKGKGIEFGIGLPFGLSTEVR